MKNMTKEEKKRCAKIIHKYAGLAAAGNLIPIPGFGASTEIVTLTMMAIALSAELGGQIKENVAKAMAIAAIKKTVLKQPIKTISKELSKLIPVLGQVVAPTVSCAMLEAAGWSLAEEMAARRALNAAYM